MVTADSVVLVQRAKKGDREAWELLCNKYYPRWLARFHRQLGNAIRNAHDTQDLVQSALVDALKGIQDLRSEAAFFSWVSTIIRRKIGILRRRQRLKTTPVDGDLEPSEELEDNVRAGGIDGGYERLLDAMISLFPTYPENMAAIYLNFFAKLDREAQARALGRSVRTVHRLTENGVTLLRSVVL